MKIKSALLLISLIAAPFGLFADNKEGAKTWKDAVFEKYPEADTNQDGVLSWPELKKFRAENPDKNAWVKK